MLKSAYPMFRAKQHKTPYLSVLNRTIEDGHISHILVTVSDITETVALRKSLEQARDSEGMQISSLHKLVHLDSETMQQFLDSTEQELHDINGIMKDASDSSDLGEILEDSFRRCTESKGMLAR